MCNTNYIPQRISSKSDISSCLVSNIEAYKEECKNILENSEFSDSQKQDLNNLLRQHYYALSDIAKAINLLSK